MFSAEIPQDIRKFKMKTVASLTMRQLLCVIVCIIVDVILYTSVIQGLQLGTRGIISALFIPDVIILAIGFVDIMEMPLEKFVMVYIRCNMLSPLERKAENESLIKEKRTGVKKKSVSRKELKKHPEYKAYR